MPLNWKVKNVNFFEVNENTGHFIVNAVFCFINVSVLLSVRSVGCCFEIINVIYETVQHYLLRIIFSIDTSRWNSLKFSCRLNLWHSLIELYVPCSIV